MQQKEYSRFYILSGILFFALIVGPYLWAYRAAGSEHFFGGFLFNPIDGNSYLAKMYQGWSGSWRFTLPYSPQPGDGAYLFFFYLTLGQFARLTGQSLQTVFHLTRLISSGLLLVVIWNFFNRVSTTRRATLAAFVFALFGSGLGWLVSFFGVLSSDLWVAEAYPFLSAYANPHFPLGMSIMIWVLTPNEDLGKNLGSNFDLRYRISLVFIGAVLGILLPFGIVIAAVMLSGLSIWNSWERVKSETKDESFSAMQVSFFKALYSSSNSRKLILLCIGGAPVLMYQIWVTQTDPILAIWNAQNLTISPPIWDLIASFAPVLLFAIPGFWFAWRNRGSSQRILILWSIVGLFLVYVPWGLQRRFLLGYLVPLAGLAGIGFDYIFERQRRTALAILSLVLLMASPTILLILIGGVSAVQSHDPMLFLSSDEKISLEWLEENSPEDALVLASPQMGLFIPAYSGRKVVYGHPFETVNAQTQESIVQNFFLGTITDDQLSALTKFNYIYFGPRERAVGENLPGEGIEVVFRSGEVEIYGVDVNYRFAVKK